MFSRFAGSFRLCRRAFLRPSSTHAAVMLCAVLPAAVFASGDGLSAHAAVGVWAMFACAAGILMTAEYVGFRPLSWACAAAAATYYAVLLIVTAYELTPWSRNFTPAFLSEYSHEIIPTLASLYGFPATLLGCMALGCGWVGLFALFGRVGKRIHDAWARRASPWKGAVAALAGVCVVSSTALATGEPLALTLSDAPENELGAKPALGTYQDYSAVALDSGESMFVLQMESLSSVALLWPHVDNGRRFGGDYLPVLKSMANDGVFFPFFLASQSPTNRAQESLHCGIVGNLSSALSRRPERVPAVCLPRLLAQAGYRTIAFRSDKLEFEGMGEFLKNVGFSEVHHADIMQPEDVKYPWGYDDCTFYRRAFAYLRATRKEGERLYVYFEVSSHHWPFQAKTRYSDVFPIVPAKTFKDHYINSAAVQDHCLRTFYDEFKAFSDDSTHLAVQADHGFPLDILQPVAGRHVESAGSEAFFIPYLYIPPRSRAGEFSLGSKIGKLQAAAQADLLPTYVELLSGEPQRQSLVPLLRGRSASGLMYEPCQVLSNGSSAVVVVRDGAEYLMYSTRSGLLQRVDLREDFEMRWPKTVAEEMSLDAFRNEYYCPRYASEPYAPLPPATPSR